MNCRDIEPELMSYTPGSRRSAALAAHISECDRCRRLVQALDSAESSAPSRERMQRIKAAITGDLSSVKPLPSPGTVVVALVLILAAVAVTGSSILGFAGWSALDAVQRIAVFTSLAAAVSLLAFSIERQIVPGSGLPVSPYVPVIAVFAAAIAICIVLFQPHAESTFVRTGLVCLRIGVECGISAGILFWFVLGRGAILNPIFAGLTAGTLAGLSGLTVLEIFCPNLNEYHILVWHLGSVLVSALGGLAIGIFMEYSGYRRAGRV